MANKTMMQGEVEKLAATRNKLKEELANKKQEGELRKEISDLETDLKFEKKFANHSKKQNRNYSFAWTILKFYWNALKAIWGFLMKISRNFADNCADALARKEKSKGEN